MRARPGVLYLLVGYSKGHTLYQQLAKHPIAIETSELIIILVKVTNTDDNGLSTVSKACVPLILLLLGKRSSVPETKWNSTDAGKL